MNNHFGVYSPTALQSPLPMRLKSSSCMPNWLNNLEPLHHTKKIEGAVKKCDYSHATTVATSKYMSPYRLELDGREDQKCAKRVPVRCAPFHALPEYQDKSCSDTFDRLTAAQLEQAANSRRVDVAMTTLPGGNLR